MRKLYLLSIPLCMLFLDVYADTPMNEKPINNSSLRISFALSAPVFTPDVVNYYPVQTNISFRASQSNGVGITEVYRSLSETTGYELITTFTESETMIHDNNLKPRTAYFYKMRVVHGSEVSPWSTILYTKTYSKYYAPTIATAELTHNTATLQITDNSYYDASYDVARIDDVGGFVELGSYELLDSGQVFMVYDGDLESASTYTYRISIPVVSEVDFHYYYEDYIVTTPLEKPRLINGEEFEYFCGSQNMLVFGFDDDAETSIEVYRSLTEEGPYAHLTTVEPTGFNYLDDVAPRVSYYYKIRLKKNGMYSAFSDVLYMEGDSDYYAPDFTVQWNGSAVEIKLTDNSYADEYYTISRSDLEDPLAYQHAMLDSGGVFILVDTSVTHGTTYYYYLEGKTINYCDGWPFDDGIAFASITIPPADYTITSFTLVDPVSDQDLQQLIPNMQVATTKPHFPNIRANTDPKTKSVMFFLNRKRRSDNGGPIFSYFPEKNGDYQPGLTEPGHYVLEATPYSEKNGKGIKGETVIIEFDYYRLDLDYYIEGFTLVDPTTDQDIGPLEDGATVDVSRMANIRANASAHTNAVMFFLNNKRHADNGPPTFTYFAEKNGDYQAGLTVTGHYVLKATPSSMKNGEGIVGETKTIEFDVVCSGCDNRTAQNARVGDVSFFPNPVVNTSQLKIQTFPDSKVRIQVLDQLGQKRTPSISLTTDESGSLQHPVSALNLGKGIYLLSIEVNGEQMTKRFVVE
jgi:hypothetical protein